MKGEKEVFVERLLVLLMGFQCIILSASDLEIKEPFSTKSPDWKLHEGIDKMGKATFELGHVDAFDTDKITGKIGGAIERRFARAALTLQSFEASVRIMASKQVAPYTSGAICFYGHSRLYIMAVLGGEDITLRIENGEKRKVTTLKGAARDEWYTIKVAQANGKLQAKMWADGTLEPKWMVTAKALKGKFSGVGVRTYAQQLEFDDFYFKSSTKKSLQIDFTVRNPEPVPVFDMLPAGEIMPAGWIKSQMEEDLTSGFYGNFDKFGTMVKGDLFGYGEKRFSTMCYQESVGKGKRGGKGWWSGEHEAYWKDGMVRMAFMTGDKKRINDAHIWVRRVLEYAAANDGYIGIYGDPKKKGGRFNHPKYNGELWTQSRIMTMLLAYYGFTGDQDVFDAVVKAVDLTMTQDVDYFFMNCGGGGIPHGVGFFEILKELYCTTKDKKYIDYTIKLFKQYNANAIRFPGDDLKTENLVDVDKKLNDHTPHLGEAAFIPHFIAMITESEQQKTAAANWLKKLAYHTNPSGSIVGDECIGGRAGSADMYYEHCAQMEMMGTLTHFMGLSGDVELADRIEKMMFNAIEGAWMNSKKGIVYCASDNVIEHHPKHHGGRLLYSSCHGAACCALCAGRALPHYVQSMWMKDAKGICALSYGPSVLKTTVNGKMIKVGEITNYPFGNEVTFRVDLATPNKFAISLRKPFGSEVKVTGVDSTVIKDEGEYIRVEKQWNPGDSFKVFFDFKVRKVAVAESKTVKGGGYYLQYGPLVFAKPFTHKSELHEDFGGGFGHFHSHPLDKTGWNYKIDSAAEFKVNRQSGNIKDPWKSSPLKLVGELIDKDGNKVKQTLVPMGTATFRRVAFPLFK